MDHRSGRRHGRVILAGRGVVALLRHRLYELPLGVISIAMASVLVSAIAARMRDLLAAVRNPGPRD
jgi:hypothetical protein